MIKPLLQLFFILLLSCNSVLASQSQSSCFDELDAFVKNTSQTSKANPSQALRSLKKMDLNCPHIPHIQHNLGVLSARMGDWTSAIGYFNKALALDERSQKTHDSLAKIHRYNAVLAYRVALQSNSPAPKQPKLQLLSSTSKNFIIKAKALNQQQRAALSGQLQPLLKRWWQSLQNNGHCLRCFTQDYLATQATDFAPSQQTEQALPAYSLHTLGKHIVVVLRNNNQQVYSLGLIKNGTTWLINNEQLLP
jgi:tetratricopeptide (TPR) repeat protein